MEDDRLPRPSLLGTMKGGKGNWVSILTLDVPPMPRSRIFQHRNGNILGGSESEHRQPGRAVGKSEEGAAMTILDTREAQALARRRLTKEVENLEKSREGAKTPGCVTAVEAMRVDISCSGSSVISLPCPIFSRPSLSVFAFMSFLSLSFCFFFCFFCFICPVFFGVGSLFLRYLFSHRC